ncbi:MAG: DUF4105 domain-containing protein [Chitinophagales bacterium]|jgi:hypothetical protein|nr:DUF4105 domain-containing protein [Sphingobacteriales bacterium]
MASQQFSVLTCSRGDEIYSTFGHSAIRYQDSSQGIDWVYNYGLFDFHDPNFIPKFCMGKLDYMVGKETMNDFMGQYVYQQREVKEQVLNLSLEQIDSLFQFLEWNIRDENKYYRYDFLFNNCATKIIDVIEQNCKGVQMKYFEEEDKKTFREHIHSNASSSVPWIDWGMDLAIGMPVDRKSTAREYCFLPEFVAKSIGLSQNKDQSLVSSESILIPETPRLKSSFAWIWSPTAIAFFLLIIVVYLKFRPTTWTPSFFGLFFVILGIGGLVIGFEWFFTEHSVTKNNWNLLWLNPLFIPYGFALFRNKEWINYKKIVGLCLALSLINAIFEFQAIHAASKILIGIAFLISNVTIKTKTNTSF